MVCEGRRGLGAGPWGRVLGLFRAGVDWALKVARDGDEVARDGDEVAS